MVGLSTWCVEAGRVGQSACRTRTEPALSSGSSLVVVVGCGRTLEPTAREDVASGVLPPRPRRAGAGDAGQGWGDSRDCPFLGLLSCPLQPSCRSGTLGLNVLTSEWPVSSSAWLMNSL